MADLTWSLSLFSSVLREAAPQNKLERARPLRVGSVARASPAASYELFVHHQPLTWLASFMSSMAAGGDNMAAASVVDQIYTTWDDMRALKQDLEPWVEAVTAVEQCIRDQGQPSVPPALLGRSQRMFRSLPAHTHLKVSKTKLCRTDAVEACLQAAAAFLLEVKDVSSIQRLLGASDLRAQAVQHLTALSQALQALLPQVWCRQVTEDR